MAHIRFEKITVTNAVLANGRFSSAVSPLLKRGQLAQAAIDVCAVARLLLFVLISSLAIVASVVLLLFFSF